MHQLAFQQKLGLPVEWINAAEARRREPHLAATLAGAMYSPQDHQVDNRKLVTALRKRRAPPARLSMSTRRLRRVNTFCDDTLKAHMARLIKHMRTVCF